MEPVFNKLKDMLSAYYPIFYLQTFEYERSWMKIQSIAKSFVSEGINVHLYKWNCVERLIELTKEGDVSIKEDDEDVVEPSMALKYIYSIKEKDHKDIFILEDFNIHLDED